MAGSKLKLNLNEQNELAFKISIEGSTNDIGSTKPNIRFMISESDANSISLIYPTEKDDEGFVTVNIPDNDYFTEEKLYEGKLEVILGNHYFTPIEVNIEFIKPLKVEAAVVTNNKEVIKEEKEIPIKPVIVSSIEHRKKEAPKKRTWGELSKNEQKQILNYRKQKINEQKIKQLNLTKEYFKDILASSLSDDADEE